MTRFISWLAVGVSAAFLIVASAAFSLSAVAWLAFAISTGVLVVSAVYVYYDRTHVAALATRLAVVVISAWTIVASLVFSQSTVQHLALASALAISGLAIAGLTEHELAEERAIESMTDNSTERESRLSAAA